MSMRAGTASWCALAMSVILPHLMAQSDGGTTLDSTIVIDWNCRTISIRIHGSLGDLSAEQRRNVVIQALVALGGESVPLFHEATDDELRSALFFLSARNRDAATAAGITNAAQIDSMTRQQMIDAIVALLRAAGLLPAEGDLTRIIAGLTLAAATFTDVTVRGFDDGSFAIIIRSVSVLDPSSGILKSHELGHTVLVETLWSKAFGREGEDVSVLPIIKIYAPQGASFSAFEVAGTVHGCLLDILIELDAQYDRLEQTGDNEDDHKNAAKLACLAADFFRQGLAVCLNRRGRPAADTAADLLHIIRTDCCPKILAGFRTYMATVNLRNLDAKVREIQNRTLVSMDPLIPR